MTMNKILEKLRKENKDQYRILGICIFLSILLVSSYAMMYFSPRHPKDAAGGRRYEKTMLADVRRDGSRLYHIHDIRIEFVF